VVYGGCYSVFEVVSGKRDLKKKKVLGVQKLGS